MPGSRRPTRPAIAWFPVLVALGANGEPAGAETRIDILATYQDPAPAPDGGSQGRLENFLAEAALGTGGHLIVGGLGSGFPEPADFSGAFWAAAPGAPLEWLAREGDPAPDVGPASTFSSLASDLASPGPVNASGVMAFVGGIPGDIVSGTAQGIWLGTPGHMRLVALGGQPAPGTGPGVTFDELHRPVLDDTGTIVFRAETSESSRAGLWTGDADSLRLVAREGDPAPGLPAGWTFRYLFDPLVSADGRLCFIASVRGPEGERRSGIWTGRPDSLAPAVLEGDPAPGFATARATFRFFDTSFTSGERVPSWTGELLAFLVPVDDDGTLRDAIFAGPPDDLRMIAAEGLDAPDLHLPIGEFFSEPIISASGKLAFKAELDDSHPDVNADNAKVVFWGDHDGAIHAVAREGEALPGNGVGTLATYTRLNAFEMGREGQLVFTSIVSGNPYKNQWVVLPDGALEFIGRGFAFTSGDEDFVLEDADCLRTGGISFATDITGHNGSDGRPTCFGPGGTFAFTGQVAPAGGGRAVETLMLATLPGFGTPADPHRPALLVEAGVPGPDDVRLTIPETRASHRYSILRSDDPGERGSRILGPVDGTGGPMVHADSGSLDTRRRAFYRIESIPR